MAITRRQFVTRLGALAAAAGLGQTEIARIAETFALGDGAVPWGGFSGKPRVVWIHGAECTGCSTSLLGTFEDVRGGIAGTSLDTVDAVKMATGGVVPRTLDAAGYNVDGDGNVLNIADVVIDVVDILYHETIMGMGGDLAYEWLLDFSANNTKPFVLVVEGALQKKTGGGAWDDTLGTSTDIPWCSIAANDTDSAEIDMPSLVATLAAKPLCPAVIAIGQCASYGGYPACKPQISTAAAGFDVTQSQTGALGVYDYLKSEAGTTEAKVINVPGCPTNPWWFILTVVALVADVESVWGKTVGSSGDLGIVSKVTPPVNGTNPLGLSINRTTALDYGNRLNLAYPAPIHGPYCPRFGSYVQGVFANKPGEPGCLQKIGCKGPAAKSLCGLHGWNAQQPENALLLDGADHGLAAFQNAANSSPTSVRQGGHCTRAGHPCMACTEKGYPDSFVPFLVRR